MLNLLDFLGRHARAVLPAGIVIALFIPDMGKAISLVVPPLIAVIYAVAFININIADMIRKALAPEKITLNVAISLFVLVAMPVLIVAGSRLAGLDNILLAPAVWYAVAPPIASTAWICGLMGLNVAAALEIIVITSLLAPFTGPLIASIALAQIDAGSTASNISSLNMLLNLAAMIFGGALLALAGQRILGKENIRQHHTQLDGLAALAMLLFLVPVFNGISHRIIAEPQLALNLLTLAITLNFSTQLILMLAARLTRAAKNATPDTLSILAVLGGNRNVGLYFGALPHDPVFTLFTAVYQVPLYLTPLVMGRVRMWLGIDRKTQEETHTRA